MHWTNKKVAVTGAGGFIGSHLVERLLTEGAQVRAMVHGNPAKNPGALAGIHHNNLTLAGGDLRNREDAAAAIAGASIVFHLGAVTSVQYSYRHPEETVATNTLGTLHVCEAARTAGVERVVHTSTAGVYGNAREGQPITEDHPVRGQNPYTAGKLGGDHVAETYYLSYDLPVTTVRLFNVYGPRMGRYLIMPAIIGQLLEGPVLRLGDLTPTRTFVYVDDIVEAYLRMAEAENVLGEVVHFAGDEVVTMAELVDRIALLLARDYTLEQDEARMRPAKSEIYRVSADTGKARRLLGWSPGVGLDRGLERTIAWMGESRESAS